MFETQAPVSPPFRLTPPTEIDFAKGGGLVPAIVQHWKTHEVLMVGYMDEAALFETCACGEAVFFSRTRQGRWKKGETSGNRLRVRSLRTDCDRDVLLVHAEPLGPVCHLGTESCFEPGYVSRGGVLETLSEVVRSRVNESPEKSYTARLLSQGEARVAQKVGEEAVELAIASQGEDYAHIASEVADLLYHLAVLLECKGVSLDQVREVLESRRR